MKASIADLRYKTAEILKALDLNESVTVLHHGRIKGVIQPIVKSPATSVKNHPFFGSMPKNSETPLEVLESLRKPRIT